MTEAGTGTLDLARRALTHARGEALVTVTRERSAMLRFARSRPTQATSVDDLAVAIAVVRGGNVGRAATNRLDDESLERCARLAEQAAEAAAARAGEGAFPGFPAPAAARPHHGHDEATARLDPAQGGAALQAAFDAADRTGAQVGGIWTAGEVETALVSTAGADLLDRVTDAFVKVVAAAPGGRTGYAAQTAVATGALDPAGVAARACAKALVTGEPRTLDPGEHTVVLEPHAVAEVLWALAETAFDGLAHAEGHGALVGRLGTRVVAPAVNLSDSPRYPSTLPRAFDAEGVAKAPLPLIQDGVAHRVVHDGHSAALAGGGSVSTGHALVPGGQGAGPRPLNMVLIGGGVADEQGLVESVERGIYVTRLWYANVLKAQTTDFTAVTRDGTFLIEDGEIVAPVHDLRLTDSALGILARVQALGARPRLTSDGELYGRRHATGIVCPPLLSAAARFTGSARSG